MPEQILSSFSDAEIARIKQLAEIYDISTEDAVSLLFSLGLKKRVKGGTGRAPAKVYSFKGKQ